MPTTPGIDPPTLQEVLESAARLQQVVPDAVLVGETALALYADHRDSGDHDHVLGDLAERFEAVLEALEATDGWVTNRVVPAKLILGEIGEPSEVARLAAGDFGSGGSEVRALPAGCRPAGQRQYADWPRWSTRVGVNRLSTESALLRTHSGQQPGRELPQRLGPPR